MATTQSRQRFETFFEDPIYRLYKNHLYNYLVRRFVVRRSFREERFSNILELGCGISPLLEGSSRAIWTDRSWQALGYLRSCTRQGTNGKELACCDGTQLSFQEGVFDCVICSEVLEHIKNDEDVIDEIHRVLKQGGELFLTCPIRQAYFGFGDRFVGHYRRYELKDLVETLSKKGFGKLHIQPVLGRLEKLMMEPLTRLFSLLRKDSHGSKTVPLGLGIRTLAWGFFPFYILINYFLAGVVFLQAQWISPEEAVTLFIRCQKLSNP